MAKVTLGLSTVHAQHASEMELSTADLAILEHQLWEAESRLRLLLNTPYSPSTDGPQEVTRHLLTVRTLRAFLNGFLEGL